MLYSFTLSMPGNTAWNGKWSGEDNFYAVVREAESVMTGRYSYSFGDGWVAAVTVKEVASDEAESIRKRSKGFCGYEWMVDTIISDGNIVCRATDGTIHRMGTPPRVAATV